MIWEVNIKRYGARIVVENWSLAWVFCEFDCRENFNCFQISTTLERENASRSSISILFIGCDAFMLKALVPISTKTFLSISIGSFCGFILQSTFVEGIQKLIIDGIIITNLNRHDLPSVLAKRLEGHGQARADGTSTISAHV